MTGRGLRDYLLQKADSMRRAAAERPSGDDWRDTVEAVVVADDATGVRKLRIRDWHYVSDSGPGFGGWSLGPSSPELLCGVIATCLTHTYLIGAARMAIPLDRVEVRVTAENNDARFADLETADPALPWGLAAHVTIEAPAAEASALADLDAYVESNCPLTAFVRTAQELRIVRA